MSQAEFTNYQMKEIKKVIRQETGTSMEGDGHKVNGEHQLSFPDSNSKGYFILNKGRDGREVYYYLGRPRKSIKYHDADFSNVLSDLRMLLKGADVKSVYSNRKENNDVSLVH